MLRPYIVMQFSLNGFCTRLMSTKPKEGVDINSKQLLLKLRNKTGYPLINCKEALKAVKYDIEQAEQYLIKVAKEKGWNKMQNISGKALHHGLLGVAKNKSSAAIVEVNCNTDFVAKTTEFQRIVKEAAEIALNNFAPDSKVDIRGEDIVKMKSIGKEQSFQDEIAMAIGKLKENILVRRAAVLTSPPDGFLGVYVHPSVLITTTRPGSPMGSFAAIASLSCTSNERSATYVKSKGRDICQHIVGMRPLTMGKESEPADQRAENSNVTNADTDNNDDAAKTKHLPPPNEKSTELLKQPFLLDTDISVEQWLEMSDVKVHDFIRFQVGETSS